jgi:hypothetical protein
MTIPANSRIATSIKSDFDTAPLSFRGVVLVRYLAIGEEGLSTPSRVLLPELLTSLILEKRVITTINEQRGSASVNNSF